MLGLPHRQSDVMSVAAYQARAGLNVQPFGGFAAGLVSLMNPDPSMASFLAGHSHYIALSVVRANHHRLSSDGQNGYNGETQVAGKRSNQICAVAGASKDIYVQWLNQNHRTHDLHHHLSHQSLQVVGTYCIEP